MAAYRGRSTWSLGDSMDDGEFDYSTLKRAELEYALAHVDGEKFPRNLANIRAVLAARSSGASPEPPPLIDAATDARYTARFEKGLAILTAFYAFLTVIADDFMIPKNGLRSIIHLHGPAAWTGAFGLCLFAVIPFVGGITDAGHLAIRPRFRWLYRLVALTIGLAVILQVLSRIA